MNHPRPSDEELQAMTVNERLGECGLFPEFETAAKKRDRAGMITVLTRVALTEEQAAQTADAVIKNPPLYGY